MREAEEGKEKGTKRWSQEKSIFSLFQWGALECKFLARRFSHQNQEDRLESLTPFKGYPQPALGGRDMNNFSGICQPGGSVSQGQLWKKRVDLNHQQPMPTASGAWVPTQERAPTATATKLLKFQIWVPVWKAFRKHTIKLLDQGRKTSHNKKKSYKK